MGNRDSMQKKEAQMSDEIHDQKSAEELSTQTNNTQNKKVSIVNTNCDLGFGFRFRLIVKQENVFVSSGINDYTQIIKKTYYADNMSFNSEVLAQGEFDISNFCSLLECFASNRLENNDNYVHKYDNGSGSVAHLLLPIRKCLAIKVQSGEVVHLNKLKAMSIASNGRRILSKCEFQEKEQIMSNNKLEPVVTINRDSGEIIVSPYITIKEIKQIERTLRNIKTEQLENARQEILSAQQNALRKTAIPAEKAAQ